MRLANNKTVKTSLVGICLALIAIYSYQIPVILLSVYLLYRVLSPYLSGQLFSPTLKLVAVFFFYVSLLQLFFLAAWLIYKETPLTAMPVIALGAIACSWFLTHKKRSTHRRVDYQKRGFYGILPVVLSLFFVFILTVPAALKASVEKESLVISVLNGNVDDAAHISLLNDRLSSNRAITYLTNENDNLRSYGQYPPGWHSLNAIFAKAIYPKIEPGTDTLFAYAISKIFWTLVLAVTFAEATFSIAAFLRKSTKGWATASWLSFGVLAVQFILLTDTYRDGFYSFIPQLITALLALVLLAHTATTLRPNDTKRWSVNLLFLSVICIGGSLSWVLVLPAFGLIVLGMIALSAQSLGVKDTVVLLRKSLVSHMPVYLLLVVGVVTQIYLMSLDTTTSIGSGFLSGIMLDGGIAKYPEMLYLITLVGLLMLLLLLDKRQAKSLNYMLTGLASMIVFVCLIYLLQVAKIDRNAYYYYKTLNIAFIMLAPLSIIGFGHFIDTLGKKIGNTGAVMSAVSVGVMLMMLIGVNVSSPATNILRSDYLKGVRLISPAVNESAYEQLEASSYTDHNLAFYYLPVKVSDENDVPSLILKTNEPASNCFNAVRMSIIAKTDFKDSVQATKAACGGYVVEFITSDELVDSYRRIVSDGGMSGSIRVVGINDTLSGK